MNDHQDLDGEATAAPAGEPHVRQLPRDYPPFLYVPCLEHVTDGSDAEAQYRTTRDGRTALLVYSSLDRLRNCCGDEQPWFGLPTRDLELLHDVRPFDVVYTDVYVPDERRARRRAGASR